MSYKLRGTYPSRRGNNTAAAASVLVRGISTQPLSELHHAAIRSLIRLMTQNPGTALLSDARSRSNKYIQIV
jgi:hypothetical protein